MLDVKDILGEIARIDTGAAAVLARSRELVGDVEATNRAAKEASRLPWSIQQASANRKLSPIREEIANSGRTRFVATGPYCVSTYVSISRTCPSSCTFKDNGCYAQAGASHLTMGRLDRAARRYSPLEVTSGEAAALSALWRDGVPYDGARGGRDLRLHVGGDVSCSRGARLLGDAVESLQWRGLGSAWTYTHRWRQIPREAWGPIAVLASCETAGEARDAVARGYAPALTIPEYPSDKAFAIAPGLKGIPCPYRDDDDGTPRCVQCRLCLDRDLLRMGGRGRAAAIVFAVHGSKAEQAKTRLRVLQG